MVRIFRYLNQVPSTVILIDLQLLKYNSTANYAKLIPDFLQNYPCACDDLDNQLLQAFGPWFDITIMVDSDHVHDRKTHFFLTVLIA